MNHTQYTVPVPQHIAPYPYSVPVQEYTPTYPYSVPVQGYPGYYSGPDPARYMGYNSFGSCLRRFFGFAPANGVRFKGSHNTWGFMGYSRRQRYINAQTGGEVDRQGRPLFRV